MNANGMLQKNPVKQKEGSNGGTEKQNKYMTYRKQKTKWQK